MKKLICTAICLVMLCACQTKPTVPTFTPTPAPNVTDKPITDGVKTMISPSDNTPIKNNWTTLGEAMVSVGEDFADVYLATSAERGDDGYMHWDDSQEWAVTVELENECFVLLNERLHGKVYIDVTTHDNTPVVSVIHTSTVGMSVTEFVYENGAFYAQELIKADGNGNNIYNSIPDYYEE